MIKKSTILLFALYFTYSPSLAADVERYIRFEVDGKKAYGQVIEQTVHQLNGGLFDTRQKTGQTYPLAKVKLLPPVVPSKVIAVGLNYRSHSGMSGGAKPELFAKLPSSIIATGEPIVIPKGSTSTHYEGELVVVIGKKAKKISPQQAPDVIFGVTAGNDVSERSWQSSDLQWLRAKASDSFAPLGPMIVRGLNYNDLQVTTRLNGDIRQSESSKFLIHDIPAIISHISQHITLFPGDVIYTGTPGSTRAMQHGDIVEVEIEGIGILRNPVVEE
ncbi:MAG: fumarylacetoacetate hydrolase family protein [Rhodospirillales bacterium]|nr:fumarylacetoacetate hydrolase family protein [Rhodospirillales bacterium]